MHRLRRAQGHHRVPLEPDTALLPRARDLCRLRMRVHPQRRGRQAVERGRVSRLRQSAELRDLDGVCHAGNWTTIRRDKPVLCLAG